MRNTGLVVLSFPRDTHCPLTVVVELSYLGGQALGTKEVPMTHGVSINLSPPSSDNHFHL